MFSHSCKVVTIYRKFSYLTGSCIRANQKIFSRYAADTFIINYPFATRTVLFYFKWLIRNTPLNIHIPEFVVGPRYC